MRCRGARLPAFGFRLPVETMWGQPPPAVRSSEARLLLIQTHLQRKSQAFGLTDSRGRLSPHILSRHNLFLGSSRAGWILNLEESRCCAPSTLASLAMPSEGLVW